MDLSTNIDQVKAQIRNCGENMKCKSKVKVVRNYRINIGYMADDEPRCSWTNYVDR